MTAEAATDTKLGTLLRMHELAFEQWEGVPEELLYDRMRTIWTGTDERGEIIWNSTFSTSHAIGASHRGCAGPTARRPKARWNRV